MGGQKSTGKSHNQAMFYEAVQGLNVLGICDESLMPYVPKSDGRQPSPKAIADAEQRAQRWQVHWIRRWNVSRPMSDVQFQGLKRRSRRDIRWPAAFAGPTS